MVPCGIHDMSSRQIGRLSEAMATGSLLTMQWDCAILDNRPKLILNPNLLKYRSSRISSSSTNRLFVRRFFQANSREIIRAPHYWFIFVRNHRWRHTQRHYPQTCIISRALVGNKIVDHSVGAALSALLQLDFHSRLNTWFQYIVQRQRQDERWNIHV